MTNQPILMRTKAEEAFAEHFAALPANDPMFDIRRDAFAVFTAKGLPHRRIEEWKYTDLRALMRDAPAPAAPASPDAANAALAAADAFAAIDRARIVFVNGHFVPALSDMAGLEGDVEFASLGRFLAQGGAILDRSLDPAENPVLALNTAFVRDGAVIRVRDGAKLSRPIEIVTVFAGTVPGLQTLRHQIAIGAGAEATILQSAAGPDGVAYLTNIVMEAQVADGAKLRVVSVQEEGDAAVHLTLFAPRIGANARFEPFSYVTGSLVARNELRVDFEGEHTNAGIRGVTIGRGKQHLDATLLATHAAAHCGGHEYFKAAMSDEAEGVFQGKIIVAPGAQKTDSKMMSRALLLSEGASFFNKPELEIFADDVVCGHGATCGQIDEEMLFFMRSRGIGKEEAKRILILAFLAEVIEEIGDEPIVAALEARTRQALGLPAEIA